MPDFGLSIDGVEDSDKTWRLVKPTLAVGQAIARRCSTKLGALRYDPAYGFDLRDYVDGQVTPATRAAIVSGIENQCLLDPRISSADVAIVFDLATETMTVNITLNTADGPFDLVLVVTSLTVELLTSVQTG